MYYLTLLTTVLALMMKVPGLVLSLARLAVFAAALGILSMLTGKIKSSKAKTLPKLLEDKKFKERVLDILEDECRIGKK